MLSFRAFASGEPAGAAEPASMADAGGRGIARIPRSNFQQISAMLDTPRGIWSSLEWNVRECQTEHLAMGEHLKVVMSRYDSSSTGAPASKLPNIFEHVREIDWDQVVEREP